MRRLSVRLRVRGARGLLSVRARLRVLLLSGLLVRVRLLVTRLLVRVLPRIVPRVLRAPWRLLIWPHGP
ncbi:hypothetical protein ACH4JS_10920 [Streptomyces sp. NPDC017638]|uniref:hypothetical protein n=1 Tax=Streptomyces sp. NPDC017638 TaxID=3365004 RepID=UPI00378A9869